MNSIFLIFISLVVFFFAYRFYGNRIAKLFDLNPKAKTPAHTKFDVIDYVPAKNWLILFGHHFSSVAGGGPILGPVIACAIWGWVPSFLWIVLGSIFIGSVHDFSTLIVSIREGGRSIADISEKSISRRAKIFFAGFVWLLLILIIAVFSASAAKALEDTPQIVLPTFGIIPLAILVGVMFYKWQINSIISTIFGVSILFGLIILGFYLPIYGSFKLWIYILLIAYAYTASILPVNIILQPRDYLSSFILFFGIIIGFIGIIITQPKIHTPIFINFFTTDGPLWPGLFVIITGGAVSGFHSLVASGTTSKQIANETDAKKIGYGGMLAISTLSVIALISVCAGLHWYGGASGFVYPELVKEGNWLVAFGKGYGEITKPILKTWGMFIGMTMLKTFILTALDTVTRITRYIGEELFGPKIKFMRNMYINSGIVILFALGLALGGWQAIWPIFGAADQLVAALAFIVITAWLLTKNKPIKYIIYPAIFMLITAIGALVFNLIKFLLEQRFLLSVISCILIFLAIFMIIEAIKVWKNLKQ